jgi:hypothetical protein
MKGLMNPILFPVRPFGQVVSDDIDVGLVVAYKGTSQSASVTVSSGGVITFKKGAAGALAADTDVGTSGVMALATYATFGALVDEINRTGTWVAYLVGCLRADVTDALTGSLLVLSEQVLVPGQDWPLYKDTSKVLNLSIRVGSRLNTSQDELNSAAAVFSIASLNTFGSGSNLIQIYKMNGAKKTETKIYEIAGGATTVADIKTFVNNARGVMATQALGEHLLVRMVGSVACTGNLQVIGETARGN